MRLYLVSVANGRITVKAYMPSGHDLWRAEFSLTEAEAVLGLLRDELKQEVGREVEVER